MEEVKNELGHIEKSYSNSSSHQGDAAPPVDWTEEEERAVVYVPDFVKVQLIANWRQSKSGLESLPYALHCLWVVFA